LALDRSEYGAAADYYRESLLQNVEEADLRAVIACVAGFAAIATARGQTLIAARLYGAVDALLAKISASLLPADQRVHDRNVATLHKKLNQRTFKTAWARGRAMTMQEAIDIALQAA
jgi:predicted hydrolase (HD superfamily)